jgi:hypothetical protein
MYAKRGDYSRAELCAKKALALSRDAQTKWGLYVMLAGIAAEQNNYKVMVKYGIKAKQVKPNEALGYSITGRGYFCLATNYAKKSNNKLAIKAFAYAHANLKQAVKLGNYDPKDKKLDLELLEGLQGIRKQTGGW